MSRIYVYICKNGCGSSQNMFHVVLTDPEYPAAFHVKAQHEPWRFLE